MRYSSEQIARARQTNIIQVAEDLGLPLKRRGNKVFTQCLWHDDTHPSMLVGGAMNTCHCFVCEKTAGAIELVMERNGVDFQKAVEIIIGEDPDGKQPKTYLHHQRVRPRDDAKGDAAFFNVQYVNGLVSMQNSLSVCLRHFFPQEVVERVTYLYRLGIWCDRRNCNSTVYPLMDRLGRVHDLKVQHYDTNPGSERFCHSDSGTWWLGSKLRNEGKFPEDAEFTHEVLFGEQLLGVCPTDGTDGRQKVVALVESPKNAVVGACKYPEMVWVATGNKGMLKREVLEVLRGRDVIVYPDEDAAAEWTEKLRGMADIANFVVADVSGFGKKGDIADEILR